MNRCIIGDCREVLPTLDADTFACCVTSPPYFGLRDYGHERQIGLEKTLSEYVAELVAVFAMVRRCLRPDGTLWLNLGDSYAGGDRHTGRNDEVRQGKKTGGNLNGGKKTALPPLSGLKAKDLVGVPWRVAFALQADGWWLRSDIVWSKPNPMPESVTDRPTKAHEYVFLLARSERYFYDHEAIREEPKPWNEGLMRAPSKHESHVNGAGYVTNEKTYAVVKGANARTVWTIPSQPYSGAHFATMPPALAQRCILAGSPLGGAVLDPFFGSGTVGAVAESLGRDWLGIDLSYEKLSSERTAQKGLRFGS